MKESIVWSGVIKVQAALFTSDGVQRVMIRSKNFEIYYDTTEVEPLRKWFGAPGEQDEHKFFAYAELRGTIINIVRKERWRSW